MWSVAPAARTTGSLYCSICDQTRIVYSNPAPGVDHWGGKVFTISGNGPGGVKHTQWTKPFIISEGDNLYDVAEELRECNNPNNDIEAFFSNISPQNTGTFNFRTSLLNAGYGIIYIDNAKGTDNIVRNAHLFEEVIRLVNQNKVGGTATGAQNVVMGQSMGGLVSRYGLAEMTKRGNDDPSLAYNITNRVQANGAAPAQDFWVKAGGGVPSGSFTLTASNGCGAASVDYEASYPPCSGPVQLFTLSPNPATDEVVVAPIAATPGPATGARGAAPTSRPGGISTVRVYDSYGRLRHAQPGNGDTAVVLRLQALPVGFYVVHIEQGGAVVSRQHLQIVR